LHGSDDRLLDIGDPCSGVILRQKKWKNSDGKIVTSMISFIKGKTGENGEFP